MNWITCKSCGTKYRTGSGTCPECGALNVASVADDFEEETEDTVRQPVPETALADEPAEETYTWESILAEMDRQKSEKPEDPDPNLKNEEPEPEETETGLKKKRLAKKPKKRGKSLKVILTVFLIGALIAGAVYAEKRFQIVRYLRDVMKTEEEAPTLPVEEEVNTDCTKLTLSTLELALTELGAQEQLSVTIEPETCTQKINWVSADASIASVDSNGLVTARSEGSANILVTCGDYAATCRVTVTTEPPEEDEQSEESNESDLPMELSVTDITMRYPGELAQLFLLNSGSRTVKWYSDGSKILTVDQDGMITALGTGTAYVYAEADGETFECIVRLRLGGKEGEIVPYRLNSTDISMFHPNEKFRLEIYAAEDAELSNVGTWKSSDESVCTVDEKGIVTAVGKGTASVTIEVNGSTLCCIVRVNIAEDTDKDKS